VSGSAFVEVVALQLVQAKRHEDILGCMRLLRDIHRQGCADAVIGELLQHYVLVLDELFDCDQEDVDDYLEMLLRAVREGGTSV